MNEPTTISLKPIGILRTPYEQDGFCPSQPVEREEGIVRIELLKEYEQGLRDLEGFSHIMVLFYLDKAEFKGLEASPPWAKGRKVGLFASRSPHRPCPIGVSVVKLKRIEGSTLITTAIDAYDETPVLDIKAYFPSLDARTDANHGWLEEDPDWKHTMEHVRGLAHTHCHEHHHEHDHGHAHHGHKGDDSGSSES